MKALFADTFYYLALLNPADEAHGRAVTASRRLVGPTVTTAWGLTEVADALADPANKPAFLALMERLRTNPNVTIVPPSHDLFRAGMVLYGQRLDKGWSLTDCISFVVMRDRGLTDALTNDRHFAQAGFNLLLG